MQHHECGCEKNMFFMMGIMPGEKEIAYDRTVTCAACGAYSRYIVYMTYSVLSIFFIPIFKFGRTYYVRSRCCNAVYQLDPESGKKLAAGDDIDITQDMLTLVRGGRSQKRCGQCGYATDEDFEFCPKCGTRF